MDLLDRALAHDHWCTSLILRHALTLTNAQLDQEFDVGHRTVRATLEHQIHYVHFWTELMSGRPIPPRGDYWATVETLIDRHDRYSVAFAEFARRLRDEDRLDETFPDHESTPVSLGSTILHVLYHHTQHRTEVRHMLHRLSVPDVQEGDPQEWEWSAGGRS